MNDLRTPGPALDDLPDVLPGVGPVTVKALAEVGVHRVADLVLHLPRRYEVRSAAVSVAEALEADHPVLLAVSVRSVSSRRPRRRLSLVEALVADPTGTVAAVWFNQPWVEERLRGWREVVLWGRVRRSAKGRPQLVNPEVHPAESDPSGVVPRYPPLGPLGGRRLRRAVTAALDAVPACPDPVPVGIRTGLGLPSLAEALGTLHQPDPERLGRDGLAALGDGRSSCHRRLAFDELLAFAVQCETRRRTRSRVCAPSLAAGPSLRREAAAMLPFSLTGAQRRVVREILADLAAPLPMARLLQGDVGSGKTAVAAVALLAAVRAGAQAALMAPTELLAEQHQRSLGRLFARVGIEPVLLTSSRPAAASRTVRGELARGQRSIVIGTHALLQERVGFERLGLVVIDEQHRFGAAEREALVAKGRAPHLLVMTATPIPRSLALTLHGDLDLSVIDELPPGRVPVRTEIRPATARARVLEFVRRQVGEGGRAYLVYPLIEASQEIAAEALEARADEVARALPGVALGVLHGRMPRPAREATTARFRAGEIQVLLATTVVEVGVDVPEASVMVVESAERFGLSQLHQLRGRVGRGSRPSWCVLLVGPDAGALAHERLAVFAATHDGFDLAEADLRLRGPGELAGIRQWGTTGFRFADLVRHRDLVPEARRVARELSAGGRLDEARASLAAVYGPVGQILPG